MVLVIDFVMGLDMQLQCDANKTSKSLQILKHFTFWSLGRVDLGQTLLKKDKVGIY